MVKRIGVRLLGMAGNALLALGLVGALASAVALVVTAIAFRDQLHHAFAAFRWSGSCLGAGAGLRWLRRKLEP